MHVEKIYEKNTSWTQGAGKSECLSSRYMPTCFNKNDILLTKTVFTVEAEESIKKACIGIKKKCDFSTILKYKGVIT